MVEGKARTLAAAIELTEEQAAKGRPRRRPKGTPGAGYRIEANHYLRTLVDAGVTVKVSLLGGSSLGTIAGKLVGYDPYSYFIERAGVITLVHKGAARYLTPVDADNGGEGQ